MYLVRFSETSSPIAQAGGKAGLAFSVLLLQSLGVLRAHAWLQKSFTYLTAGDLFVLNPDCFLDCDFCL